MGRLAVGDFRGGSRRCASALAGEKEAKDGWGDVTASGCELAGVSFM